MGRHCHAQVISTHALREEGDVAVAAVANALFKFLPTPSARRATTKLIVSPPVQWISTHALREEGDPDGLQDVHQRRGHISTHALREEGDYIRSHSER